VHILMQIMAEGLKSVRITEDRESAEQLPEDKKGRKEEDRKS
jgi:hypothetical protein